MTPGDAANTSLTWTSDDESIAKVNSRGVVTAVGTGSTVITAESANGLSDTCQIAVSSVLMNYALSTGSTMEMTAAVGPSDNTAVWTSDDEGVASVDTDGKVTAKAPGLAMITVTAGGVSQTCGVAVYDQTVTSVALNRTSADLTVGGSIGLTAYVDPGDAVNKDVTWTSDDTDVVTVNDSGTVTAVGKGSTTVTAKSGGQSASCSVTVTQPVSLVSIGSSSITLSLNETADLVATVSPSDATDADVTWTSSDESIATVDASGEVTAKGFGSATVTAEADGKFDMCTINIVKNDVTAVSLSNTSKTMGIGDAVTLSATVSPGGATDADVTWTSTNPSVATVNSSGRVTAVSEGHCAIIATADGISGVCSIGVERREEALATPTATPSPTNGEAEDVPDTGDASSAVTRTPQIVVINDRGIRPAQRHDVGKAAKRRGCGTGWQRCDGT